MKEEYRFIKINGKEHNWYSISNFGNLISHRKIPKYFKTHVLDTDLYKIPIKYSNEYKGRANKENVCALKARISFPADFFQDTVYSGFNYMSNGDKTIRKGFYAHQLVMQTFRPLNLFPPKEISIKDWNKTPENIKNFITKCVYINHIDHDPTNNYIDLDDPSNDNLEWCSPMHNSREATKFYGGNTANKIEKNIKINQIYGNFEKFFE